MAVSPPPALRGSGGGDEGTTGTGRSSGTRPRAGYTPVAADAGHSLQARVSYRDDDGSHTAASAQTEPVDLPPARRERMLQVGLTGFARTAAAAAVQVIGDRFTLMERPGAGHDVMDLAVTLNGRPLGLSDEADADARAEMVGNVAAALGIRAQEEEVSWAAPSGAQLVADSAFSAGGAPDRGGSRWGVWGSGD